ncbi:MAG: hypothetical protein HZC29_01190 [Thaumarchaeota archaeon]|nr:hypothetical protein [Nitrososphaerota archaeon]
MSLQQEYDIEFTEGEISDDNDPYLITVKEKDGSAANLAWAEEIQLIITTPDLETTRFTAKLSDEELSLMNNVVIWDMTSEQTSGYTGRHVAQIIATKGSSPITRQRKTYLMSVMVYPKTDPDPAP